MFFFGNIETWLENWGVRDFAMSVIHSHLVHLAYSIELHGAKEKEKKRRNINLVHSAATIDSLDSLFGVECTFWVVYDRHFGANLSWECGAELCWPPHAKAPFQSPVERFASLPTSPNI